MRESTVEASMPHHLQSGLVPREVSVKPRLVLTPPALDRRAPGRRILRVPPPTRRGPTSRRPRTLAGPPPSSRPPAPDPRPGCAVIPRSFQPPFAKEIPARASAETRSVAQADEELFACDKMNRSVTRTRLLVAAFVAVAS